MKILRPRGLAALIIVFTTCAGIGTRVQPPSGNDVTLDDIHLASENLGLRIIGLFQEPITGRTGLEIALPLCNRPLGVFPVGGSDTQISPAAFRYQSGPYTVSYVYGGSAYSESWISYKLSAIRFVLHALSIVKNRGKNPYSVYLKIWTPTGCAGLTPYQAAAILRGEG